VKGYIGKRAGKGEANHKQILWWPGGYTRSTYGKTPLLHWHQKKVPIPCLSHEFNLDAIENYSQDPPLPIYLKIHTLPPCGVCIYVMSLFKNLTPKFSAPIYLCTVPTPNPEWRKGVWRKGNRCGSTTTLYLTAMNFMSQRCEIEKSIQGTIRLVFQSDY
jgi:hypothetical protein